MKKKRKVIQPSSSKRSAADESVSVAGAELRLRGRRETKVEFPVGEPDLEALRSVTREWLVPLLVEKFLREQGIDLRARPSVAREKTPISSA